MIEKNESIFNYKGTSFALSEDKPSYIDFIVIVSSNPDALNDPVQCVTSSNHIIYISTPLYHSSERYIKSFNLLHDIIRNDDEPFLRECFSKIENANKIITVKGNHISYTLITSIDKAFSIANINNNNNNNNNNNLYNEIELKSAKSRQFDLPKLGAIIDYIENNVKWFIKNNRIYAGLSFLKSEIQKLEYGFAVYQPDKYRTNPPQITFYTSHICWCYGQYSIDSNGHIINKVIESLLLLLSHTDCFESIIDIYQLQEDIHIELNTLSLVRLIEALLKNSNIKLLESAVARLKVMEPQHPIIELANRSIRRTKVFEQISKSINIDLSSIQTMEGIDFEIFLESQFVQKSFKVERTKGSGDFGADLIIETASGTRGAVQAKRFKNKTNLKAVQEVVASLPHYAADFGIVIAISGFFPSAIKLAESNNVELWDEDSLISFLSGDISFSMLQE